MQRIRRAFLILVAIIAGWSAYGLVESKLLATDDAAPTSQDVVIHLDDATQALLKTVTLAHQKPFTVTGKFKGNFDVAGQVDQSEFQFTSTFGGSGQFRHESTDLVVVSNAKDISVYDPKANSFSTHRIDTPELMQIVQFMLGGQNPALLVAAEADAQRALIPPGAKFIESNNPGEINIDNDGVAVRYQFDPEGHFQSVDFDFTQQLSRQGVSGIQSATYTITFDKLQPATIDADTFEFTPPPGARDLAKESRHAAPRTAIESLLNKPAPPFEGRDLDGNVIGLPGFKDRVVVLDFWATWCGPCKPALEHLKTYHERFGDDVMILTINCEGAEDLDETARTVRAYFERNNFDFKTLLDDGEIGQTYNVSALPTRLLIGRDGKVKKVTIGAGGETDKEFDEAVEAEVKSN